MVLLDPGHDEFCADILEERLIMAAKKKSASKKKTDRIENYEDVYGIVLIVAAVFVTVSLFFTNATGPFGRWLLTGLKWGAGAGRYFVPLGLFVWGVVFLIRWRKIDLETMSFGLILSFASVAAILHVPVPVNKMFVPAQIFAHGGIIGAATAYILVVLVSQVGAYIILSGALTVGLVLSTGVPINRFITGLRRSFRLAVPERRLRPERETLKTIETREPTIVLEKEKTAAIEPTEEIVESTEFKKAVTATVFDQEKKKRQSYQLPPLNLLKQTSGQKRGLSKKGVKENIFLLEKTLRDFEVDASITRVVRGPTVTRFELQLGSGVKVNRILALADDIALALASADVRILAPIPGKSAIGIEVPNEYRELVTLGDILSISEAQSKKSILTVAIGKDIAGQPVLADLGEMPHMLIAGATGSGKSVCINSLLISVLYRAHPEEVKMLLIDPKRIELNMFNDLPHLLTPVITNPKQAASALAWAVSEMERRFELLAEVGSKNINSYNTQTLSKDDPDALLPYVLIIIDELADLMMVAPSEVEDAICRIAQLARAVGIHLIVATQRPSVDIITGLIKANITSRIAFAVSSQTDSRVIMDSAGAEKLVGKGDMLFVTPSLLKPKRVQGPLVTEAEIQQVTNFIRDQAKPQYRSEILEEHRSKYGTADFDDDLLDEAIELVVMSGTASVSFLQRKLRVGYSRAARLVDMLEDRGIVSSYDGSRPRQVLVSPDELNRILGSKEH